ncbi:DUF6777 domain-containing protein [Streptomyces sp. G45]|uniref:DUF6777 domain-containing protein n=1 Tax=Streptomyces sp. G45 TaxID=3406627 RepID=UPI003C253B50
MAAAIRTYASAFAIALALAATGCSGGDGEGGTEARDTTGGGRELFLQPVAAQGPDPFTDSTARTAASPPPVTRSPQPPPSGSASPTDQGLRSLEGGTPGLYGGTHRLSSCDVGAQIRHLTAAPAKARAFAGAVGIAQGAVPAYLRGLTPVVLRADTRVTNHGYRDGRATAFQSVLQAGTAVLVDDRGLPRVRCACGNPLKPPVAFRQTPRHHGQPWTGFRPTQVIVVVPAPRPITVITIVNVVNNTWIERRTGDEHARHDRPAPPPRPTPTDSTDPADPTDPTDSLDPTGPTDTASPTGSPDSPASPDSLTPTEPTDPGDTQDLLDPTDPPDPTDPTAPSDPTDPTFPTAPDEQQQPDTPDGPDTPGGDTTPPTAPPSSPARTAAPASSRRRPAAPPRPGEPPSTCGRPRVRLALAHGRGHRRCRGGGTALLRHLRIRPALLPRPVRAGARHGRLRLGPRHARAAPGRGGPGPVRPAH